MMPHTRTVFFQKMLVHIYLKLSMAILPKMAKDNFHQDLLFLERKYSNKCSRNGRARPGPAGPGPRKMVRMREGADLTKNRLSIEKLYFRHF